MASLSRDANGTKRVTFAGKDGERLVVRLGSVSVKAAESFRLRVEALIAAKTTGTPMDAELSAWVRDLPEVTHSRLVRVGIVEQRSGGVFVTMSELLERFVAAADVKPATLDAYRQTTNSLRDHFGVDASINTLMSSDADSWRKSIAQSGIALATVAKRVNVAKSIFRKAVKWKLIPASPFEDLRAGSQSNPERSFYVSHESIRAVLAECPDNQWRSVIALSRYGGLRCPSEVVGLKWGDVNWERGRLTVRSPKTAGHEGHAVRSVPMSPELRSILQGLFDNAEDGSELVVPRLVDPRVNLRKGFHRIIERAGLIPWPRLFHNLRASCATDWVDQYPHHAVAKWLGHSPLIAATHYLQVRDAHFDAAAGLNMGDTKCVTLEAQNASQHPTAVTRTASQLQLVSQSYSDDSQCNATQCETAHNSAESKQWAKKDSNLRRRSQQIYNLSSLTA